MPRKSAFSFLKETFKEWQDDGALDLGAALAYYTIFSLAPLLLVVIAVAGLVFGREAVQGQLVGQIAGPGRPRRARRRSRRWSPTPASHGSGVLRHGRSAS